MASLRRGADEIVKKKAICLTININFNYNEYTYALACTRKIDVSCGLQVAHTSYDNDDDNDKRNLPLGFTAFTKCNLQPATAVALHD